MGTTVELFGEEAPEETPASVTEPEKEESAPETASAEPHAEEEPGKTPYTPDELAELLANDEQIDTKRLTLEGQALMKSFQRGLTPRLEEVAELKRQLADMQSKAEAEKKPKTWADFFNDDPEGTLNYIDQQIAAKRAEARQKKAEGYDAESDAIRDEVDQWKDLKTGLVTNKALSLDKELKKDRERMRIVSAVPEYDRKRMDAAEYMTKQLGFTQAKAEKLLEDVDNVKVFFGLSEKAKAAVTARAKEVKNAPELGRPGSSNAGAAKPKETFDYEAEVKRAQQTGDWMRVFKYKGVI